MIRTRKSHCKGPDQSQQEYWFPGLFHCTFWLTSQPQILEPAPVHGAPVPFVFQQPTSSGLIDTADVFCTTECHLLELLELQLLEAKQLTI